MVEKTESRTTEQDALEEEEREREWQKTWGEKADAYIREMDDLLARGTREARMQLVAMFSNRDFFEHYKQVDEFATMFVVLSIYEREDAAGIPETILDQADTVAGLMDCMFRFRMILYRLDFAVGQETEEELLSFLKECDVSSFWMTTMMTTCVIRPFSMALKLERIFESAAMVKRRLSMLEFMEEYFPGSYLNISKIAAVYQEYGQEEEARKYRRMIPELPEELREQETVMLKLQELLCKARHKEAGADRETVLFMRENMVSDIMWEFLMQHSKVVDKEYYLQIANILFEFEELQKAGIILRRSLKEAPGDELILCLLAELAIREKDMDTATAYLSQVAKPGDLTKNFQRICIAVKEERTR